MAVSIYWMVILYLICFRINWLSINQFNLKYGMSGYADLRISSSAVARVTGVPGQLARRTCKKVLQSDRWDIWHPDIGFVLLTISAISVLRRNWGACRTAEGAAS